MIVYVKVFKTLAPSQKEGIPVGKNDYTNMAMMSSFEIIRSICGDKWKFLIISYLFNGPRRFGELMYHLDSISPKVLSDQLPENTAPFRIQPDEYWSEPPAYFPRPDYLGAELCAGTKIRGEGRA